MNTTQIKDFAHLELTTAYNGGWCARLSTEDGLVERFYGPRGGEWELRDGVKGRQLVGTCDLRISLRRDAARRQIRAHLMP